jgi:hypothetical protein
LVRTFRACLPLALAALLGGCREEAQVRVTQGGDAIVFDVVPKTSFRPCINLIEVRDADRGDSLWGATNADKALCVARMAYGSANRGYEPARAPVRLRKGSRYVVSVSGNGFTAEQPFALR